MMGQDVGDYVVTRVEIEGVAEHSDDIAFEIMIGDDCLYVRFVNSIGRPGLVCGAALMHELDQPMAEHLKKERLIGTVAIDLVHQVGLYLHAEGPERLSDQIKGVLVTKWPDDNGT